MMTDKLTYLTA